MTDIDLREAFDDLADRIGPAPAASVDEVRTRARHRQRVRRFAVGSTLLAVLAAAVGIVAVPRTPAPPSVVDATPADTSPAAVVPPPAEDPPVTMLVAPSPLPDRAGPLALAVVNRSDRPFDYGLGGDLQRWDGQAWRPFRRFTTSMTASSAPGELIGADEPLVVEAVGLTAQPNGTGPLEWVTMPALDPGWYRLTRDVDEWTVASAVVQVTADAERVQLTAPDNGPVIDIETPVVAPEATEIRFVVTRPKDNSIEQANELAASMSPTAELQHWAGQRWEHLADLTVDKQPTEGRSHVHEWAVHLPRLAPGTYQLVQASTIDENAIGHFWVSTLHSATTGHSSE